MIQKLTQEEKELLLKDLCARLPYGIIIYRISDNSIHNIHSDIAENIDVFSHFLEYSGIDDIRPYLRPMQSMTKEEHEEYKSLFELFDKIPLIKQDDKYFDFINSHHFDHRGLIPMGLAIEAPKDMYTL